MVEISSKKIVPWSATSNNPFLEAIGAGKRAFHVAEKLRFEKIDREWSRC